MPKPLVDLVWSLLRRVGGGGLPAEPGTNDDARRTLAALAAARDVRVVPDLLPVLAGDAALTQEAAAAIERLMTGLTPPTLAWIDEQARNYSRMQVDLPQAWWKLSRASAHTLARSAAAYPSAIGLIACHWSGYVRETALDELARISDGRELPFLALRANDWVFDIAEKAAGLLAERLVPANREAVLTHLPFIVRTLGQHRQDHQRLAGSLKTVLLSDGGDAVLAHMDSYDTPVRRFVYALALSSVASGSGLLRVALDDRDPVVRLRALRRLATVAEPAVLLPALEAMLTGDRVPIVRKTALSLLAERDTGRVVTRLPLALLDPASRVRDLARFLVKDLDAPIAPRELYLPGLEADAAPQRLATAILGLGETGTRADAALLHRFTTSPAPRVRRAALRAIAWLDVERGVPEAVAALGDRARPVRAAAQEIVAANRGRVDLESLHARARGFADPRARREMLALYTEAPRWTAAALLLEALADPDAGVQRRAAQLLDRWLVNEFNVSQVAPTRSQLQAIQRLLDANRDRMTTQSVELLTFSLKNLAEER